MFITYLIDYNYDYATRGPSGALKCSPNHYKKKFCCRYSYENVTFNMDPSILAAAGAIQNPGYVIKDMHKNNKSHFRSPTPILSPPPKKKIWLNI